MLFDESLGKHHVDVKFTLENSYTDKCGLN
jgi:hypothetical protein